MEIENFLINFSWNNKKFYECFDDQHSKRYSKKKKTVENNLSDIILIRIIINILRNFNLQKTYKSKLLVAHFSSGIYYIRWYKHFNIISQSHAILLHGKRKESAKRTSKINLYIETEKKHMLQLQKHISHDKNSRNKSFFFFCYRIASFILFENRNNWFRRKYESKREQKKRHEKIWTEAKKYRLPAKIYRKTKVSWKQRFHWHSMHTHTECCISNEKQYEKEIELIKLRENVIHCIYCARPDIVR